MTITSNQVVPPIDITGGEQRPGLSDVAWAERAYHQDWSNPATEQREKSRRTPWRLGVLVTTLAVVLAMAGLVLTMRYEGSSSPTVVHPSHSSQTVTDPQPAAGPSLFTPPLVGTLPTLPQTVITPGH
jgi:hypothetical protein